MRTLVTTIELFPFNELSDDGKEKAIAGLYDINVDHDWFDFIYDEIFSLGMKCNGFDTDRGSYCEIEFIEDAKTIAANIIENHGKDCDTSRTAVNYCLDNARMTDDDAEKAFRLALQEDYLTILRNEYEYLTSDESIIETIECNEYEFTREGVLV